MFYSTFRKWMFFFFVFWTLWLLGHISCPKGILKKDRCKDRDGRVNIPTCGTKINSKCPVIHVQGSNRDHGKNNLLENAFVINIYTVFKKWMINFIIFNCHYHYSQSNTKTNSLMLKCHQVWKQIKYKPHEQGKYRSSVAKISCSKRFKILKLLIIRKKMILKINRRINNLKDDCWHIYPPIGNKSQHFLDYLITRILIVRLFHSTQQRTTRAPRFSEKEKNTAIQ